MQFTDDTPAELFNNYAPTGSYRKINFVFGENNSVVVGGKEYPLLVPHNSCWRHGFHLQPRESFEIVENQVFSMKIDFDPNRSIIRHSYWHWKPQFPFFYYTYSYFLSPFIRITEINSVSVSSYDMETEIDGETYVVQFSTDGIVKYVSSKEPGYIFNGSFDYDSGTDYISLSFDSISIIDQDCLECGILGTATPYELNTDSPFKSFMLIGYTDSQLTLQYPDSDEQIVFKSRNTFGPYEDEEN